MKKDTVAELAPLLLKNQGGVQDDELVEYIHPVDRTKLTSLLVALDAQMAAKPTNGDRKAIGLWSKNVGAAFEAVVAEIFCSSRAMSVKFNQATEIGEVDFFGSVQTYGMIHPLLHSIAPVFYGEVKNQKAGLKSELVTETVGNLETHKLKCAFVAVYKQQKIKGPPRYAIHMQISGGRTIVPIGKTQIESIRKGRPALAVLYEQFQVVHQLSPKLSI